MGKIHDLQKIDEWKIISELWLDNFLDISIIKRQEIINREIIEIIKEGDKINFIKFLEMNFLDLVAIDKSTNPETYEICAKSFNYMLRQFIENKIYKWYLLSWKRWSDMYMLRNEIVTFISEFIDNDIIELLLSNLEKKVITKEKNNTQNDDIEKEQEQQHIIEDIYDPDNVDAYF